DPDGFVRLFAVRALGRLQPEEPPELATLLEAVKDRDADLRAATAVELAEFGSRARSALPVLVKALRDRDTVMRRSAAFAVGKIGLGADTPPARRIEIAEELGRLVRTDETAYQGVRALLRLGADAWPAAPALAAALRTDYREVDSVAATVLARLRP